MKQNICVVIFLLLSTICKAQTFIYPQNDSILTEYNDGKFWAYLNKNDFVVGLSCFEEKDDYGKYYHLDIFIKNLITQFLYLIFSLHPLLSHFQIIHQGYTRYMCGHF